MEVERAEVVDFTVDLVVGFCVRRVRDDLNDDMMFVLFSSISYGRRGEGGANANPQHFNVMMIMIV